MKKLKRLPSGLSYDEVRGRQKENERAATGKEETARHAPTKPSVRQKDASANGKGAPTSSEPRATNADGLDTARAVAGERSSAPDAAEKPVDEAADQEPDRKQANEASGPADPPPADSAPTHGSDGPNSTRQGIDRPKVKGAGQAPTKTLVVRGGVAYPARGVSRKYDQVFDLYGKDAALTYLLDAAREALPEQVKAGQTAMLDQKPDYSALPARANSSRSLSRDLYNEIVKDVDPLNILKPYAIGTIILQGAVNLFIAQERPVEE